MSGFKPLGGKGLTPEQEETLKHFLFNELTNMLEADRSIMTILSSLLLGAGYRISSSANEMIITDLRTDIDYYHAKTGIKDQSIPANQDVTGLVPLATPVLDDDLDTIEANGPEDTSGAVGYEGSNIVPFDVAVISIEYTFEETVDPARMPNSSSVSSKTNSSWSGSVPRTCL